MNRFEELEYLVAQDIQLRKELAASGKLFGGYNLRIEALHIENGKKLDSLLTAFGWPDLTIDGEEAVKNAWYIVMHAISLPDFQRNVLKILEANPKLCPPKNVAMLHDRIQVFSGRKQKYGTQFDWNREGMLSPFPMEDPKSVDEYRNQVGLPLIVETTKELRERAVREGDKSPSNFEEHTLLREDWMLKVGWISDKSEIDPAYSAW